MKASIQEEFNESTDKYLCQLNECFVPEVRHNIGLLAKRLLVAWTKQQTVYIIGNGGSAANAIHIANDLHYGIGGCGKGAKIAGLRVEALPANQGIITCLGNDIGYENIFSHQLCVKGQPGDVLIALSGSGNSQNIVNGIEKAKETGMDTFAILGFEGGKCKEMVDVPIHFSISDMQIAEDTQLITGHLCMQWLNRNKPTDSVRPLKSLGT